MEGPTTIGEFISGVFYLVAAARIFQRYQRNGKFVEQVLAAMLFCLGLCSVFYSAATIPVFESVSTPMTFSARIIFFPVPILMAIFTRRVFRANESWAVWPAFASAALLALGLTGSIYFNGDWEGFSISNPWIWVEWLGYTSPYAWASTEAFIEYRRARRRGKLGMCDPLVSNRLLLWTLFAAFQVCCSLVILPQYLQFESQNAFGALWDGIYAGFMIAALAMIWTAFFPAAFYKRWIMHSSATPNPVEA